MRDSIEERVLKTLEQKRSLFEEIFSGGDDEVTFGALGQQAFLETVRSLVGEGPPDGGPIAPRSPGDSRSESPTMPATEDARMNLVQAGVQLLEALAAVMAEPGRAANESPLPPETLRRGAAALQTILRGLGITTEVKAASQAVSSDAEPPNP